MARPLVCAAAAALALFGAGPASARDDVSDEVFTPVGAAEYSRRIGLYTTLSLRAADVSATGRRELDRTLQEVRRVMAEVGFEGTTEEFFAFLRTDDRFYFPDTDSGRAAYLEEARHWLAVGHADLGMLIEPPAGLAPPAVGTLTGDFFPITMARYVPPRGRIGSGWGPASGMVLFNLSDMRSAPSFLLPVITFHEGGPGHHLQGAMDLPWPERLGNTPAPAFVEGWGAYAQQLPWELDMVEDPYADAGRLALLCWSSARLVVDVGLHVDGWTQEEAVVFLIANSPMSEAKVRLDVKQSMKTPGLTTIYLLGMLQFQELRARAEAALGPRFDLREFHETVLSRGSLSFAELEAVVDTWIARTAATQ